MARYGLCQKYLVLQPIQVDVHKKPSWLVFERIKLLWSPKRTTHTHIHFFMLTIFVIFIAWSRVTPVRPYKASGIFLHQLGLLDSNNIKMSSITLFVSFLVVFLASVSDACQPSQAVKDCYATCVSITTYFVLDV